MNSAIRQQLSPFEDERWLAEQWLINAAGILPDSSIDNLLMFAYMQKGVLPNGVTLEIDRDEANGGANPSVTYKLKLDATGSLGWHALKRAEKIKSPILRKLTILGLTKGGAPYQLREVIQGLAQSYLPKKYRIEVVILE
jgi:hypothetical protein